MNRVINSTASPATGGGKGSPFDLDNEQAYSEWRAQKLAGFPRAIEELQVSIADGYQLSGQEMAAVHRRLQRANFVIYTFEHTAGDDKVLIRELGRQFGLERLDDNLCSDDDSVTSLRVVEKRREGEYIPYTNKRLNWHTDGYYNSAERQIQAVILHCVQPAAIGGENALLDHEIAYMELRDENPDYIHALMAPDAMTIPPNVQQGKQIRPAQTGPVFSVNGAGQLHMRYSARGRNIVWKDDTTTQQAAECLLHLFQGNSPYIFRHRLKSGQGVLSNNVLHCRSSFEDDVDRGQTRLLYRARYFDRIVAPRAC